MNMREIADNIYNMNVSSSEKIYLLEQNIQDCMNEMDAQDQNMRPELRHRLSEGLRKSKDYVRALKLSKK